MFKQSRFSGFILLALGIVIGALAFSHFNAGTQPKLFSAPVESASPQITPSRERPITSLCDLNNAFVDIAEATTPSVVTVFTEKVTRYRQGPFSFFSDPFRDFFGDDFGNRGRQRNTPEREFRQQGLGSGVIVRGEGYILTNNHVVDEADSIYIRTFDERTIPAKVIGADPRTDLAVIKVEAGNLTPIRLGNSDELRVGEWVLAIGSPLSADLAHTVTQGIVSAKGRSEVGLAVYEDFIQTDAAINPGNSGGALVNLDGELVGINTAIASRNGGFQGIGFAVPINMARSVTEALIKNGKVVRGYLGVAPQDLDEKIAKSMELEGTAGALVANVYRNAPADKAGIEAGDVILSVDGQKLKNSAQLRSEIAAKAPGTTVDLHIVRDGKQKTVTVTLGELPGEDARPEVRYTRDEEEAEDLGFTVATLTRQLAERYQIESGLQGVVVTDLDQTSAAHRAGLREGDLIRSVNRQRLQNVSEFKQLTRALKRGDNVLLQVVRRSGSLFLAFEL
jgi:serine protease Do